MYFILVRIFVTDSVQLADLGGAALDRAAGARIRTADHLDWKVIPTSKGT